MKGTMREAAYLQMSSRVLEGLHFVQRWAIIVFTILPRYGIVCALKMDMQGAQFVGKRIRAGGAEALRLRHEVWLCRTG